MKLLTILYVILFIHNARAYSAFVDWKTRINKYAALVNCSYYMSSELQYRDYFEFENNKEYKFYFLSQNGIKFLLGNSEHVNSLSYEIVIGYQTSAGIFSNGYYYQQIPTSISYVQTSFGHRLKTLNTPQIIQTDQPNEIVIGKFEDGKVTITVNQNTPLQFKSMYDDLNFISFSSIQESTIQEFFYECNNGPPIEHAVETITTEQIVHLDVGTDNEQATETTEKTTESTTEQLSYPINPFSSSELTYNSVDDYD